MPELVKDIFPGAGSAFPNVNSIQTPRPPAVVGEVILFVADDGASGRELWRSDGTAGGTFRVKDIHPGPNSSIPHFDPPLVMIGGIIYFRADDGAHGTELWRSDGTEAGTYLVKDIAPGPNGSGNVPQQELVNVGGTLFFTAHDANGNELWRSDGTEAGTYLIRDIGPGFSSDPKSLTAVGGALCLFVAGDSTGRELWRSDGTAAGTFRVKDIHPFTSSSVVSPLSLIDVGGTLFFQGNDGNGYRLWRSDGTEAGTRKITDRVLPATPNGLFTQGVAFGDVLFFAGITPGGDPNNRGLELWRSDGTDAGTFLVKDVRPGPDSSSPQDLFVIGETIYFRAFDATTGQELWRSDGTEAGTFLVKDILPGAGNSTPHAFTDAGETLFFAAAANTFGFELWRSDGTEAGTLRVGDIWPGQSGSIPHSMVALGRTLVFTANDGTRGRELWSLAPDNVPPAAADDAAATDEDNAVTIDVLANDADSDGDAISLGEVMQGAHGSVALNPDGTVTYTPAPNFFGGDGFTYTVSDGRGGASSAAVNITVNPVNDAPAASDVAASLDEDTQVEITLAATDVDGPALGFALLSEPLHGTLSAVAGDKLIYTPDPNFSGADSFTFTASDGAAGSNVATVMINARPVADPPVLATVGNQVVAEGALLSLTLSASDPDGEQLTFGASVLPDGATLDPATGVFSWTPAYEQAGVYAVTFNVTDPTNRSASETVRITVNDVVQNLGPVCSAAYPSLAEIRPPDHRAQPVSIFGVTDPDGDPLTIVIRQILQDEPTNTSGDGNTWIDGGGLGTPQAWVRAERSGTKKGAGNGRVYEIFFDASDGRGKSCTGSVKVGVPHDQGRGPAADDGRRYDSTVAGGPCLNCAQ